MFNSPSPLQYNENKQCTKDRKHITNHPSPLSQALLQKILLNDLMIVVKQLSIKKLNYFNKALS